MTGSPHRDSDPGAPSHPAPGRTRNLVLRIASAALLAPLVIVAAYFDGMTFLILCVLAAGGILWEWTRLVAGRSDPGILVPGCCALLAAMALVGWGQLAAAAGIITIGAAIAGLGVALRSTSPRGNGAAVWAVGGVAYASIAFFGSALLRRDLGLGFQAFLFLAATVWATDIFAYVVGRAVGGPLLWPQVSPNKTWAGAVGGLLGGVAGGVLVAYASGVSRLEPVGVVALVLSALAQAGDLFESAVKRRFGAKDSSRLIPGHGGLMDRLDGFLVAALAAALIGILRAGTDAPAHGLLVW